MKLSELKVNPRNPRLIKDENFKQMVDSIKEDSKFLELWPIAYKDGVIYSGNMRYRALLELGYKEVPNEWVRDVSKWTDDEIKRLIIKSNTHFGSWDWDILSSDFETDDLVSWGIDKYILKLDEDNDVNKMWEGMPDFVAKEDALKSLLVHFETQEDIDKFAKLVGETITEKTKYIWYPRKEKEKPRLLEVKSNE